MRLRSTLRHNHTALQATLRPPENRLPESLTGPRVARGSPTGGGIRARHTRARVYHLRPTSTRESEMWYSRVRAFISQLYPKDHRFVPAYAGDTTTPARAGNFSIRTSSSLPTTTPARGDTTIPSHAGMGVHRS